MGERLLLSQSAASPWPAALPPGSGFLAAESPPQPPARLFSPREQIWGSAGCGWRGHRALLRGEVLGIVSLPFDHIPRVPAPASSKPQQCHRPLLLGGLQVPRPQSQAVAAVCSGDGELGTGCREEQQQAVAEQRKCSGQAAASLTLFVT